MFFNRSFWLTIWRFTRPEVEELVAYVSIFLVFMTTAFYQVMVVTSNKASSQNFSEAFAVIEDKFQFLVDGDDTVAHFFTFGAWFVIGALLYVLIWFLVTFASGAFRDVEVAESFVHPSSFHKSDYWTAIVGRLLLRTACGLSLLFYTALWCAAIAPVWLASFKTMFTDGLSGETILDIVVAVIGIGFSLHIAAILLRLTLLRSRYFYQSER